MVAFPADISLTARRFLEKLLPITKSTFEEFGKHAPMLFCYKRKPKPRMHIVDLADVFRNDEDKNGVEALMIQYARRGFDALALVTECWMAPDTHAYDKVQTLADHPLRIEIMNVLVQTPSQEIQAVARIERGSDGKQKPLLGEWDLSYEPLDERERQRLGMGPTRFQNIFRKARR